MSGGIEEWAGSTGTADGEESRPTTNSWTGAEDVQVSRHLSKPRGEEDDGCDEIECAIYGFGLGTKALGVAMGSG